MAALRFFISFARASFELLRRVEFLEPLDFDFDFDFDGMISTKKIDNDSP